ncbi:hypothetical protein [Streptomyces sp. Qhu_M48]|uniref:hypothetical protein n=1 Tax=Streptomyces sp. Qhu_M48 TaxID=3435889 RepID=UPI003F4F7C89
MSAKHCPNCSKARNHRTYIRHMTPNSYNTPAAPQVPNKPPWLSVTYCVVCAHTVHTPTTAPAA